MEKGLIVKVPKRKKLAWNYAAVGRHKVMGKIMIGRIPSSVESKLRKEHVGFRPGRRTTEQIFILRNIIEQSIAKLYSKNNCRVPKDSYLGNPGCQTLTSVHKNRSAMRACVAYELLL